MGRQLATTIEKVQLYSETRKAYEDLRRTQEQLLQSEKMDRPEVQGRIKKIAADAPAGSPLKDLAEAQVIAVNPDSNNVTSDTFTIKSN